MTPEQALVALFRDAAARLQRRIRRDLESGRLGTARYRQRQLAAIHRELQRLGVRARPLTAAAVALEYVRGVRAAELDVGIQGAFAATHRQAAVVLADNAASTVEGAVDLVGRRVDDVYRQAAIRETALGVAAGDTRREISTALERRLIRESAIDALTGFVDRAGRRWPLDVYAQMVARTTTREAMTAGTINRIREARGDVVTVSAHVGACEICIPYQGRSYSLTGRTPGLPRLEARPPFHPNCRHVLTPGGASLDDTLAALEREFSDPAQVAGHVDRVLADPDLAAAIRAAT